MRGWRRALQLLARLPEYRPSCALGTWVRLLSAEFCVGGPNDGISPCVTQHRLRGRVPPCATSTPSVHQERGKWEEFPVIWGAKVRNLRLFVCSCAAFVEVRPRFLQVVVV